ECLPTAEECAPPTRSADEHDLASRSRLNNFLVCTRGFDEWQLLANDGTQSAVFEPCKDTRVDVRLFLRGNGPERECADRSATPHQLARIDGNLTTTTDHDDAAIVGQK